MMVLTGAASIFCFPLGLICDCTWACCPGNSSEMTSVLGLCVAAQGSRLLGEVAETIRGATSQA